MTPGDFTRGEPYLEYRPREVVHPRRLRVYILLPDGRRHGVTVEDHPDIDVHVAEIARALNERDRRIRGRRVGGGPAPASES